VLFNDSGEIDTPVEAAGFLFGGEKRLADAGQVLGRNPLPSSWTRITTFSPVSSSAVEMKMPGSCRSTLAGVLNQVDDHLLEPLEASLTGGGWRRTGW